MSDAPLGSGARLVNSELACQERAGFLFAHACDQPCVTFCAACRKPLCLRHCRMTEQGESCVTCARASGAAVRDDDPYYYHDRYAGYSYYDAADRHAFSPASGPAEEPASPLDVS